MNPQAAWYLARASGIVAWALLTASVIWGMLLSTKLLGGRPKPAWLLDLHRFLGASALVFTALHLTGLVADNFVHFGVGDVLVPFASGWKPLPVALGVVSLYALIAVEVSSVLMRRLPRRLWKNIHLTSYVLFWTASIHGVTAGTDTGNPFYFWASTVAVVVVLAMTITRMLAPKRQPKKRASAPPRERTRVPVAQPVPEAAPAPVEVG